MTTQPSYDKILDPIDDISTSIEALLDGSFGRLMGDQRESLKRIYSSCWGLHTLFLDVITSIGIENIAQREGLEEHFRTHIEPVRENARSLMPVRHLTTQTGQHQTRALVEQLGEGTAVVVGDPANQPPQLRLAAARAG